jgi:hypothetical protein
MIKTTRYILISMLVFFGTMGLASAQDDSLFTLQKKIPGNIASFAVDNLENLYILSSTGQLKKLSEKGDSLAVFNNVKKYGEATLIDVANPLKILLYYRDFSTVVVLDRLLNMRTAIDLRKSDILQAATVALSYDSKIWVYDEVQNKLKKMDDEGKLLQETPDFRLLFNQTVQPQQIFDQDKLVYLYDAVQGLYVFDYYGALKNKILITKWKHVKIVGKYIYGTDDAFIYRYNITTFRYDKWPIPAAIAGAKRIYFTANRLYVLNDQGINVYGFR